MSMVVGFIGIGTPEMLLIVFVTLLLFGGKKLPELARGLGRGIREFKDASEAIKRDITEQINNFEKEVDIKNVMVEEVESAISDAKKSLEANIEAPVEQEVSSNNLEMPVSNPTNPATEEPKVHPILKAGAPVGTYTHTPGREPDYVGSSGVYYNNPEDQPDVSTSEDTSPSTGEEAEKN